MRLQRLQHVGKARLAYPLFWLGEGLDWLGERVYGLYLKLSQ